MSELSSYIELFERNSINAFHLGFFGVCIKPEVKWLFKGYRNADNRLNLE